MGGFVSALLSALGRSFCIPVVLALIAFLQNLSNFHNARSHLEATTRALTTLQALQFKHDLVLSTEMATISIVRSWVGSSGTDDPTMVDDENEKEEDQPEKKGKSKGTRTLKREGE